MSFINLSNISVQYRDKCVLSNFSISIDKGEKILLVGDSGVGKSTIFQVLLGLTPHRKGTLMINNVKVTGEQVISYRPFFSFLNQDVNIGVGLVKDILKEISSYKHNSFPSEIDIDLASHFDFDLSLLNQSIENLSGGERQRLGIIISIMMNRECFLLDEITSALDERLKKKVVDYFSNINQTVVVISHDSHWGNNKIFKKVIVK